MFRLICLAALLIATVTSLADEAPFEVTEIATFNEPWAMTFLPDGRLLVTEKRGRLYIVSDTGSKSRPVEDTPEVDYGGQGGLGDVILHPDYENNGIIYLSYAEPGMGHVRGAAVARGRLDIGTRNSFFKESEVIWRQDPKVTGYGHYGHRLVFDDDGYLFISSGERQKLTPAQQMDGNLGKIVRLHENGTVPKDNPFFSEGDVTAEIWSLGRRTPLGLACEARGRLWGAGVGRRDGDEMSVIVRGAGCGWRCVCEENRAT